MPVIESRVDVHATEFAENRSNHLALIAEFRALEQKVRDNSARAKAKFDKRGQLLPRERLARLLDHGAPFVEISTLCGLAMHDDDGVDTVSGGAIIAGMGFIANVRCVVLASDSGIKGGALTPMGIEKMIRAQTMALENRMPLVQLIESAGANLLRQADIFIRAGVMFANLARLGAKGVPVISVVHGSSTAGGAYQTGLSDYVIAVRNRTRVFLAGPPLLKAATGEVATDEELGGAQMHTQVSGTAEYMAENDADGLRIAREVIAQLDWNANLAGYSERIFDQPKYDVEQLLGIVPTDYRKPYDVREVIARIVDGSEFLDFKPDYGVHTVTGHARIHGGSIGIIGNNGPIDVGGAGKAAQFIQLCCQSNTPLVFLQNTTGYMVGKEAEEGGIVKHGSKMVQAVTNATVPRITLHIGASFGAGNYGMSGRGFDPRFIFAWPNSQLSVMGGEQAARTMAIVSEEGARARGKEPDGEAIAAMSKDIIERYTQEARALFTTARLWDDGLIDPRDTRLLLAFLLATCREADARQVFPNSFGVGRM